MSLSTAILITTVVAVQMGSGTVREQPSVIFQTGSRFQSELERPLSGSWSNVELRDVLNKISRDRRIAILLDRRIDPTVELPINITNRTLRQGLQDIALLSDAETCIAEPVVYVAPAAVTRRLRTLIELRSNELHAADVKIPEERLFELSKRHRFSWLNLDTPSEILRSIADRYRLHLINPELVPHDLWPGNTLPDTNAAEALSLILNQLDLTFRWLDRGQGIELGTIPEQIWIEKRYRVKGRTADEATKLIIQRWPKIDIQPKGSELVVRGLLEEHEAVAAILTGSSLKKPTIITGPAPIRQRQFTLKVERVPVRALMKKLEESDIAFEYDAVQLKAAGVDLDQAIGLEVEKASADEFFKAVFEPLKLVVEIDNLTVKLTPE